MTLPRKPGPSDIAASAAPEPQAGPAEARAPTFRWLTWSLSVVVLLAAISASGLMRLPLLPLVGALAVLLSLHALAYRPLKWSDNPAWRRTWMLWVIPAPTVIAIIGGPLGLVEGSADPGRQAWMLLLQNGALAASLIVPLALLWPLRGARRFTPSVGALNLLVGAIVNVLSVFVIAPGS
jgi:hypothetical protein